MPCLLHHGSSVQYDNSLNPRRDGAAEKTGPRGNVQCRQVGLTLTKYRVSLMIINKSRPQNVMVNLTEASGDLRLITRLPSLAKTLNSICLEV